MTTAAIIQARMTSTRLPGKIMMPVTCAGEILPMLEIMSRRVEAASKVVDTIIIATTDKRTDDVVEELVWRMKGYFGRVNIECFRGSEDDVLSRVVGAAQEWDVETIVELTGDCPLIAPDVIEKVVRVYKWGNWDYVSNILKRTYPRGMDTQVFSRDVLERVDRITRDPVDREHVSIYIYTHPEEFALHNVESGLPRRYHDMRLTVDTPEDYEVISRLCALMDWQTMPLHHLLDIIDLHPEIIEINKHVEQKVPR